MKENFNFIGLEQSDMLGGEQEFFPIITDEDEKELEKSKTPKTLAVLPLRNVVLFPGVVFPLTVGRDKSLKLIKEAYAKKEIIGTVVQKDLKVEEPGIADIYSVGTSAKIIRILEMPDGTTSIIIQGQKRLKLTK